MIMTVMKPDIEASTTVRVLLEHARNVLLADPRRLPVSLRDVGSENFIG